MFSVGIPGYSASAEPQVEPSNKDLKSPTPPGEVVKGTKLVEPELEPKFRTDFLKGSGRGLRGVDVPVSSGGSKS